VGLAILAAILVFWVSPRIAKRLVNSLASRSPATARHVAIVLAISTLIIVLSLGLLLLGEVLVGDVIPFIKLLDKIDKTLSTAFLRREIPWLTIYVFINTLTATLLVLPVALVVATVIVASVMIARRTATAPHRITPVA
jgi:hypothetical protein